MIAQPIGGTVFEPQATIVNDASTSTEPVPAQSFANPVPSTDYSAQPYPSQPQTPMPVADLNPIAPQPMLSQQAPSQPTPPPQPNIPQNGPTYASFNSATASSGRGGRKRLLIAVGVLSLFVLLTLGTVFGYYLPNKPTNVWKTGLNRSGKAVDALVVSATEKDKLESYKQSEITAKLDATAGGQTYSGSFDSKFDANKADGSLSVSLKEKDKLDKQLKIDFLGEQKAGATLPTAYFRFSGVSALGLDAFIPEISTYENKWIGVDEAYLKSIGATQMTVQQNEQEQITSADIAEIARAVSGVTKEYVFSSSSDKSVFEQHSFVAKEKTDGITAYHYKVGVNKQHAKDYCKAVIEKVYSTNAYKKLPGVDKNNIDKDKESSIKECQDSIDSGLKDSDDFDLWVDARYKLIYKVRFVEKDNKDAYTEVGQKYKGGDSLSLFVAFHDGKEKADAKLELETSLKTNNTKGSLTAVSTKTDSSYDIKLTMEAKPYKGDIKIEKPNDVIPIQDIFKKIGVDPATLFGSGSVSDSGQSVATDSKRKVDINSLQAQVEAYFAQNGYYPSLADMNSASWRKANLLGLDETALQDPGGSGSTLVASPASNKYAYTATGCSAKTKQCTAYTLTATLSTGEAYKRDSLN